MDDTRLYFVLDDGSLCSMPKDGSGPPTVLATVTSSPFVEGLAVDANYVYFTVLGDESDGTVDRVPKGGGEVETLASGQIRPWGITLDDARVYWIDQGHDQPGAPGNDGSILALDKDAGTLAVLASGEQMPTQIVLAGQTLLWADGDWGSDNGSIRTLALDEPDGGPTSIISNLGYIFSQPIVATDGNAYWATGNGPTGSLESVPLVGGPSRMIAAPPTGAATLATYGDSLYYTDATGALRVMPLGGGSSVQIAAAPALVNAETFLFLLADAKHLFAFDYFFGSSPKQGEIRIYDRPPP